VTVAEAIKILQEMPDKEIAILVDCPYCGRGTQLATVIECVVLRGPNSESPTGEK